MTGTPTGCDAPRPMTMRIGLPRSTPAEDLDGGLARERVLVERARAGDQAAFEVLVREHADRLYAVVLRFVASADEAEEATQEAFVRAWRGIDSFHGRSRFFTWLYRIGVNEAKRRAERRPPPGREVPLEDQPLEDRPDSDTAPHHRAEQAELRDRLEDALSRLSPDHRATVVLRDVEGLSTHEAAEVLGLKERAFKSRLHRARLALREILEA